MFPWLFSIDKTDVHIERSVLKGVHEFRHERIVPRGFFPNRHVDEAFDFRITCDEFKIHPETGYVFESKSFKEPYDFRLFLVHLRRASQYRGKR